MALSVALSLGAITPAAAQSVPRAAGDESTVTSVVSRGRALLERGDWTGAVLVLRAALPEGEADGSLHSALARAYSEIGEDAPPGSAAQKANFRSAVDHARRAVELIPGSAQAHLDLSIATGKMARVSGVKSKLELAPLVADEAREAIRLDPGEWRGYHVLGVWHRELATLGGFKKLGASLLGGVPEASMEEALANLEKARRLAPSSIRNRLELGRTYLKAHRKQDARKELAEAVRLPPSEPRDRALQREARRELAELES